MTIMLDTNIIISAALFPNGRTAEAFFQSAAASLSARYLRLRRGRTA